MASQTPPPATDPNPPREFPDPAEYLDDPRFNRKFTLPPTPDLPENFQVTYADFGHNDPSDPSSTHVLLLCGPLLGSRYLHIAKDALAKRHKASAALPPNRRIRAWLAIVPALLAHLGVRHVVLAAHSGGTLYALNTLLHHRHLLSPSRPYVALCAPWVHPSHSGAAIMSLTSTLPQGLVGSFDKVAGFMVRSLVPATVGFSNAVSGMLSGIVPSLAGTPAEEYTAPGVSDVRLAEFEEKIWGTLIKRVYAESVQGLGQDAVLLLKRDGNEMFWGEWEDYDKLVPLLAQQERELGEGGGLEVEVFFAASDAMIGTDDGPKWFEQCWREEQRGERIKFSSSVVPKADHDSIVSLRFGVFERIIRSVGSAEEGTAFPDVSAEQTAV
uniref:Interferon-induced gtp-binding protein mx2 n=1 Tax=Colletotrichum fructicola (strain Nara gc5) TaxID=1213859 RepID=L2GJM2_COLFN